MGFIKVPDSERIKHLENKRSLFQKGYIKKYFILNCL